MHTPTHFLVHYGLFVLQEITMSGGSWRANWCLFMMADFTACSAMIVAMYGVGCWNNTERLKISVESFVVSVFRYV